MLRLVTSALHRLPDVICCVQQPGGKQAITGGKCVTLIEPGKALKAESHFRSDLQCQALRHLSLHTGGDRVRELIVTHGRSGLMTDPKIAREVPLNVIREGFNIGTLANVQGGNQEDTFRTTDPRSTLSVRVIN